MAYSPTDLAGIDWGKVMEYSSPASTGADTLSGENEVSKYYAGYHKPVPKWAQILAGISAGWQDPGFAAKTLVADRARRETEQADMTRQMAQQRFQTSERLGGQAFTGAEAGKQRGFHAGESSAERAQREKLETQRDVARIAEIAAKAQADRISTKDQLEQQNKNALVLQEAQRKGAIDTHRQLGEIERAQDLSDVTAAGSALDAQFPPRKVPVGFGPVASPYGQLTVPTSTAMRPTSAAERAAALRVGSKASALAVGALQPEHIKAQIGLLNAQTGLASRRYSTEPLDEPALRAALATRFPADQIDAMIPGLLNNPIAQAELSLMLQRMRTSSGMPIDWTSIGGFGPGGGAGGAPSLPRSFFNK